MFTSLQEKNLKCCGTGSSHLMMFGTASLLQVPHQVMSFKVQVGIKTNEVQIVSGGFVYLKRISSGQQLSLL